MSLFKSKVVQEGGLYSSATTLNEEQLFLVRFRQISPPLYQATRLDEEQLTLVKVRQISPPIYQVKVYIGAEILYAFLASVGTIDFAHSFALARPLQSNNISTSDLGTTLATNLGKFDVARIQERILNFVLLKTITESFAVLSTPQKSLDKILPIDLIDISDIATISPNKKISLDAEILTDLIKFVEKRSFDAPEAEFFLSKVFGKVLENTLNIQEDQNIDFAKVLANLAIAAGIIQSISVEKVLANQSTVDFLRTIALTKPLENQTEADFTQILNVNKSAKDDLEIQEDQIFDFAKVLTNQSIVDFLRTISLTKPLENTSQVATDVAKTLTKSLADNAETFEDTNVFDGKLFTLVKIHLHRAEIAEQISLLFDAIRVFDDAADIADNTSLAFSTTFTNDVDVPLEELSLNIGKSRSDLVSLTDDIPTFATEKILSDITNTVFAIALALSKATIEDSVSIEQEISKETGKTANNQVEVNVNRTLLVGKSIDDATLLLINLVKVLEKPLTNQGIIESLFAASTSKPFQNDVASSALININTNKKFSENPTADSTGLIRNQGYALEDYFLEGYVGQELTF